MDLASGTSSKGPGLHLRHLATSPSLLQRLLRHSTAGIGGDFGVASGHLGLCVRGGRDGRRGNR